MPTGILPLDRALSGGLPANRLSLICGRKGAFKSTIALKLIKNFLERCPYCQKEWGECEICAGDPPLAVYIDVENAMTYDYIQRIGLDPDRIYIYQPPYGEAAAEYAEEMCKLPEVGIIVNDSNAALTPLGELDSGYTDGQSSGTRAKLIARMTRALSILSNGDRPKLAIMINHVLNNVRTPGDYLPGGDVQKFLSSTVVKFWPTAKSESRINLELELKYLKAQNKNDTVSQAIEETLESEDVEDKKIGTRWQDVGYLIENSKTSPSNVSGEFALSISPDPYKGVNYGDVDDTTTMIILGVSAGIIEKRGAGYIVNDLKFGSQKEFVAKWRTDKIFHDDLYHKITQIKLNG